MSHDQSPSPSGGARILQWRPREGTVPARPSRPLAAPLRVVFMLDELDIGGTEQQILELSRRIDRDRFEPHVCCFRWGRKADEIASLCIPVHHEPKRLKADPGLVLRLAQYLRREQFDIVQTYLWTANTWGRLAARIAGNPIVLASERNVDIWEERYKRVIGRWLARSSHSVIANSEAVRQYLLKRGELSPEKVVTIYNGVNFDRFEAPCDPRERRAELHLPEDAILAGVVARVEPAKDHATLLDAMSRIADRCPKLHLAVIGGGSQEPQLKTMAANLGLADRVHFTGFRTDSAEWLRSLDFSVLSSVKEGLSNTVIESMAAGRAVAATDVGGNAEVIVPNETGFLLPARDPIGLADAMAKLAESESMRREFGAAARQRVQTLFSVETMVRATEAHYASLANRSRIAA